MPNNLVMSISAMAVLILMSAYFSATETAFSALNRTRIKTLADGGNHRAQLVLKLSEEYDRLLSTILVGNNIVNIAVASIGTVLFIDYFGDMGATLSTVVVTIVVLIFGEISPKSLAKENPERFALFSAPIIRALIVVLSPINFLFTQWKKLLSRLFVVSDDRRLTQQELITMVEEVEHDGGIDRDESELLRSAIEFTDREAEDILTPRVDLEAVPWGTSKEEVASRFTESRFSRILVYKDTIDNVVGVIHQKDFYSGSGVTDRPLEEIIKRPVFVTPSMKISDLLKLLQKSKSHIAVVSDEYGGTMGIVTMEDILEELVGEIWDEHDEVVEDFSQLSEDTYRVSCSMDLDKMYRFFGLDGENDSSTVSGWVMEELGRIPNQGDHFVCQHLDVTVTRTDDRRVVEIMVKKLTPEEQAVAVGE
ncbi:MAG: HlyC/CorC family transporter [Eubacteriales bacterium]|jgi:putative hemolysin